MFGIVNISTFEEVDLQPLKSIISTTRAITLLLCRLVKNVRPLLLDLSYFDFVNIKIVAILVIVCWFAY